MFSDEDKQPENAEDNGNSIEDHQKLPEKCGDSKPGET